MSHAGKQHLANERSSLARPRTKDLIRRETSFEHNLQFQRRRNFDAAAGCFQSGAQLWNRVRLHRVQQLRGLRKQFEERLSLTLGLVEIVDVEGRAVSLEEFLAETTCDHDVPPLKTRRRAFPETTGEQGRDPPFLHWRSRRMPPSARTSEAPCDAAWQAENVRSVHRMRAEFGPWWYRPPQCPARFRDCRCRMPPHPARRRIDARALQLPWD